ncbi:MAG: hypothetical protein F6K24_01190 [Okeania sp. SIO2D1]|nr:hypothetical protein [Okeania sp. SIO2D1]
MGPDAYRTAGLEAALGALGHTVTERGNVAATPAKTADSPAPHLHQPHETIGWTAALADATELAAKDGMPILLGGALTSTTTTWTIARESEA